jgi:hypothetical protein
MEYKTKRKYIDMLFLFQFIWFKRNKIKFSIYKYAMRTQE